MVTGLGEKQGSRDAGGSSADDNLEWHVISYDRW